MLPAHETVSIQLSTDLNVISFHSQQMQDAPAAALTSAALTTRCSFHLLTAVHRSVLQQACHLQHLPFQEPLLQIHQLLLQVSNHRNALKLLTLVQTHAFWL